VIDAFRSEWVKLRRRGMLIGAGIIVAFALLNMVLTFTMLGSTDERGPGGPALTAAQLSAYHGFDRAFGRGITFIGVVALAIAAIGVASEYSEGTIRNLLVRQPRRLSLLGGKVLALAAFLAAAVLLAYLVSVPVGAAMAPDHGVSTDAWFTAAGWRALASGAGNATIAALGFGLLGAVLGLVIRAPAPALGAGVAYLLPLENLLSAAWRSGNRWLPGQLLQALASGGGDGVSYERATILLALYSLASLAIMFGLFLRRDVLE